MKSAVAIALLFAAMLAAAPARAADGYLPDCEGCPPPNKYDSQETVKTQRTNRYIAKTINTYEMAPAKPSPQGGITVRTDVTLVNFVVHRYRVIEAPALVDASEAGAAPVVHRPSCKYRRGRYGGCRPLHVRG